MARRAPGPLTGDVQLRDVADGDLPIFFEHQLDPDANHMAAFTARDRDDFTAHWTRILVQCDMNTSLFLAVKAAMRFASGSSC